MGRRLPRCLHCHKAAAVARGLCVDCFADPVTRGGDEAAMPVRMRATPLATDAYPTDSPPGSEDKVAILAKRWRAGLPLWVPGDAGRDDEDELRRMREANQPEVRDGEEDGG